MFGLLFPGIKISTGDVKKIINVIFAGPLDCSTEIKKTRFSGPVSGKRKGEGDICIGLRQVKKKKYGVKLRPGNGIAGCAE